jgi:hypothetical protein
MKSHSLQERANRWTERLILFWALVLGGLFLLIGPGGSGS